MYIFWYPVPTVVWKQKWNGDICPNVLSTEMKKIARKYVHSLYCTFKSLDKKEDQSNVWRRKFTV